MFVVCVVVSVLLAVMLLASAAASSPRPTRWSRRLGIGVPLTWFPRLVWPRSPAPLCCCRPRGDGDDVLLGGTGFDTLDGGAGANVVIDGENVIGGLVAGQEWLAEHARLVDGETVIDVGGKSYTLPAADLVPPT